MRQPVCKDSEILKARLHADVKVYGDSVARLILANGDVLHEAYERAELARRALKSAKKRLNQHLAEHHCEPQEPC